MGREEPYERLRELMCSNDAGDLEGDVCMDVDDVIKVLEGDVREDAP